MLELVLIGLAFALGIGGGIAVVVLLLDRRRLHNRLATQIESLFEEERVEPTPVETLQHHHRPGPKDANGIRHCRCGDRYLDGMVV